MVLMESEALARNNLLPIQVFASSELGLHFNLAQLLLCYFRDITFCEPQFPQLKTSCMPVRVLENSCGRKKKNTCTKGRFSGVGIFSIREQNKQVAM